MAAVTFQPALAGPITIGNDVIDRARQTTWHNFITSLDDEVFNGQERIAEWSVFAANSGSMALLVMNDGVVMATDTVEVQRGVNIFPFTPDFGSSLVQPGYNLGLWIGSASVDFGYITSGGYTRFCPSNYCSSIAPGAGQEVQLTTVAGRANWYREYSLRVEVPEPGTLALLGLGLAGMGFAKRKKIT